MEEVIVQNLTNVHKKLDRLTERLAALDTRQISDARRQDAQMRLLHQIAQENARANRIANDALMESLKEISRLTHDASVMAAEAMQAAKQTDERIAALVANGRKH